MTIVSRDACNHRTDRISAFVEEVRRYLYNECLNQYISVSAIDCFCHDMFICMNRTNSEYSFMELLHMLGSEIFMAEAFSRYKSAIC